MKIENPKNYKVALYIRLSKEDDKITESQSITNQRSLLQEFVMNEKLEVFDTYVDDGFSGTTFDRPGFNKMIKDIEAKKINMVITKDMSRLGRDYIQTGYYMEKYFPESKVRYISLLDGVDTGVDSSINDITPFRAIMNDMYAKDISKKIKSVKQDKQRKGLFIGGKAPYGYLLSKEHKNTIEIDEEAAIVVKKIFNLAVNGKSCREIAIILNLENILSPAIYANLNISKKGLYTGKWSSERVTFMLKNQVYIGNMVQGRRKKVNYKSKKCINIPVSEWTIVENTHAGIIEKDVFDKVQLLIESRKSTRARTYDYLLKGMIYCHECGYPLGVISRPIAKQSNRLYFVCRTYQRFTIYNKCTCHCVNVDTITDIVVSKVAEVCKRIINKRDFSGIIARLYNEVEEKSDKECNIRRLTSQINRITLRIDKIYSDKLSGMLMLEDFERFYIDYKEERNKIQQKLLKLQEDNKEEYKRRTVEELIESFIGTIETNKELVVSLIKRIELTKDKELQILFRFKEK